METLQLFGSWDQEIDLWFPNHKPLIPTLQWKMVSILQKYQANEKNWEQVMLKIG